MADIFEEVEEGLRQERLTGLWKKYGIIAYLGAAVLIGGVAFNEYRQIQAEQTTQEDAARLEVALEDLNAREYEAAASKLTAIIDDGITPSKAAVHYLAGVRLDGNGDAATAAEVLANAAGDVSDPTEKLALIKSAYLKADSLSRSELEAFLTPLTGDDGSFAALAKELIAAKALADGDIAFARREFSFLTLAQNVPPGVVTRATQALDALPPIPEANDAPAPADRLDTPADTETGEPTEESPE